MKKLLLLLLFPFSLSAQILEKDFVATVTYSGFTQINDSLFRGNLVKFVDALDGNITDSIQAGFICLDGTGKSYRVKVINSRTFSSLNVDLIEYQNLNRIPVGRGLIVERFGSTYQIPNGLVNSLGISSVLQAKIINHNVKLAATNVPVITPDTFYLNELSGVSPVIAGDTIQLRNYVRVADTATMLLNYPSTAGYGIIDAGKTWRADTTNPNGLATRLFAKTLSTSILTGQVAHSNGSNLVGSSGLTYSTNLLLSGSSTSDVDFRVTNTNGGASARAGFLAQANNSTVSVFRHTPSTWTSVSSIGASSAYLYSDNDVTLAPIGNLRFAAGGSLVERMRVFGATGNFMINSNAAGFTDVTTSLFSVRSTTKASSPFPLHTLAESDAITGVQGNFDYETTQNGLRGHNGTRKFYLRESTQARGTSTYALFSDVNGQSAEHTGFRYDPSTSNFGLGGAPSSQLHMQGNKSAASWTTNGIGLRIDPATYTNTTSSGSINYQSAHSILSPTFAATSTTTFSNPSTLYVSPPIAGTNVTHTNSWAIRTAGASWLARLVAGGGNTVNINGLIGSLYSSSDIYTYSGQTGSSKASIAAQAHSGGANITVIGVLGNAVANSPSTNNNIFGVIGEVQANTNHTSAGGYTGVAGRVAIIGPNTGVGVGSYVYPYSSVSGGFVGGTFRLFSGVIDNRNNNGAALIQGYHYAGIPGTISGLNTTVTTHNPLAISFGSTNQVTNTWSYIDHKTSIGATALSTEELDVFGDTYIRDSTRLTTTPAHTAITGLLTRDANGWVGLASLAGGLSYNGGVLTGANAFTDTLKRWSNVLFVSPNGDNATAVKNKLTKPWLTPQAARDAATSGDLIVVLTGSYSASNLWKPGVDWHFENVVINNTTTTEYASNTAIFKATSSGTMEITGNLTTGQLLQVDTAGVNVYAQGNQLGQIWIGSGAIGAKLHFEAEIGNSQIYVSANASDSIKDNTIYYHTRYVNGNIVGIRHNNSSTVPTRNSITWEADVVNYGDRFTGFSDRGMIASQSLGASFTATKLNMKIGKGLFNSSTADQLLALPLYPTSTNNRNELTVHCDDCEFKSASTFSRELRLGGIELSKITGKYTTSSTAYPLVQNATDHSNTNRVIFNGEFTGIDTSLFVLANPMNWQFEGTYTSKESDDVVISTSVGNGSTKPILKNFYVVSPATTPITSSAATTWNVTGAHENKPITKDADITFLEENAYIPVKRDTTIFLTADTDYNFSAAVTTAQIASRYNRIIIHMTLSSGVGADKTTTLHTPDANLMQCEILIRGTDNTVSYDNEIAFGTNNAISSDGTNASGYTLAQGQGLHVRVVYNGSAYKYIYY